MALLGLWTMARFYPQDTTIPTPHVPKPREPAQKGPGLSKTPPSCQVTLRRCGRCLFAMAGQRDEAIIQALAAVERDPDAFLSHWALHLTCHWGKRFPEAVAARMTAVAVSSCLPLGVATLASAYADWGKVDEAPALYDELLSRNESDFVPSTVLAYAAIAVRDFDAAVDYAKQALDQSDPLLVICAAHWPDTAPSR